MNTRLFSHIILSVILTAACSPTSDMNPGGGNAQPALSDSEWLLPSSSVFDGGPGKDGIPSIDVPLFSPTSEIGFLEEDDLILGIRVGDEIKGYPHPILDWHEIVNDEIGGKPLAITYCPLTGTGIAWDRMIGGKKTTFGVSGLLYNNNLIPYDRETDSNWSQMLLRSVNGDLIGDEVGTYAMLETRWETWKELFPDAPVLNLQTGFSRQYGVYPYGDYRTNHDFLLFPLTTDDDRLPRKERGMGVVVGGEARFYRFQDFASQRWVLQEDMLNGQELLIVGSASEDLLLAFNKPVQERFAGFEPLQDGGTVILRDELGNEWDLFGKAVSGPDAGAQLEPAKHFIGYWFAWGAFYPGLSISR